VCKPVISPLGRPRQEEHKSEASLTYEVSPVPQKWEGRGEEDRIFFICSPGASGNNSTSSRRPTTEKQSWWWFVCCIVKNDWAVPML